MRIIDLFSGAGGLTFGFYYRKKGNSFVRNRKNSFVFANEFDSHAAKAFSLNYPDIKMLNQDIKTLDEKSIKKLIGDEAVDLIIGGPPCQSFSTVGQRIYDEKAILYEEYLRILSVVRPKMFLFENVKGILSLEHGEVMKMIMSDFNSIGYTAVYKVLNAADYGVPQLRNRVIIVGIKNGIDFKYEYPRPTHNQNGADGLKKWVSVGEALKDIPDPDLPNNVLNHTYSHFKLKFNGYIGNREINPNKPAPTVTARGDDKGGVVVLHHPNNKRRMTCRELAIVQSFPLNYEFKGNRSSIYRQIGNAVPPLLGKAIAEQFNLYKGE